MTTSGHECLFCAIAAGEAEASVVHADEDIVVFMDLYPVTHGHLVVVPRRHAVGFEDLDPAVGARVWATGHEMARALRRSELGCEGINMLVCDGAVAFQTVFHFHLHVIPRYPDDGWTLGTHALPGARERSLLDGDAEVIRATLSSG